jgi:hypothetical protein
MELVPRELGESGGAFEAYSFGKLPGIATHVVRPLGGIPPMKSATLRDHLHAFWWESPGTLRVPPEVAKMKLNHDLVLQSDVPTREQLTFLLNALGLELVEVTEPRTVWVARYDGRKLKDWREVKAPVPNPQNKPIHPGMAGSFGRTTMADLFRGLMYYQDLELTAKQVRIIDETGLSAAPPGAEPPAVASESPYFGGPEALPLATQWFAEQFGVTFTEEVRPQTVNVVRPRSGASRP